MGCIRHHDVAVTSLAVYFSIIPCDVISCVLQYHTL